MTAEEDKPTIYDTTGRADKYAPYLVHQAELRGNIAIRSVFGGLSTTPV
jgi:hypothetical protein